MRLHPSLNNELPARAGGPGPSLFGVKGFFSAGGRTFQEKLKGSVAQLSVELARLTAGTNETIQLFMRKGLEMKDKIVLTAQSAAQTQEKAHRGMERIVQFSDGIRLSITMRRRCMLRSRN